MKMLVSDFDGTLIYDDEMIKPNVLKKVKYFSLNNIFVIATGRCTNAVKYIDSFNINYKYIIACSGALIVDRHMNVIYENPISKSSVKKIYEIIRTEDILSFEISDGIDFGICLLTDFNNHPYNCYPRLLDKMVNPLDLQRNDHYLQFSILFKDVESLNESMKLFSKIKDIKCHVNGLSIDITNKKCSKVQAVSYLEKINSVEYVTCIGDGLNDHEMINKYNGFAMRTGCEENKRVASHVVKDLEECIDIIEGC